MRRDCEIQSSIKRLEQVPDEGEGDAEVTKVEREAETEADELRTAELDTLTDEETTLEALDDDGATLEALVDEGTTLEALVDEGATLEALLEDTATELVRTTGVETAKELAPAVPPQPKAMLLSCHVAVVEEKPDQTKP